MIKRFTSGLLATAMLFTSCSITPQPSVPQVGPVTAETVTSLRQAELFKRTLENAGLNAEQFAWAQAQQSRTEGGKFVVIPVEGEQFTFLTVTLIDERVTAMNLSRLSNSPAEVEVTTANLLDGTADQMRVDALDGRILAERHGRSAGTAGIANRLTVKVAEPKLRPVDASCTIPQSLLENRAAAEHALNAARASAAAALIGCAACIASSSTAGPVFMAAVCSGAVLLALSATESVIAATAQLDSAQHAIEEWGQQNCA